MAVSQNIKNAGEQIQNQLKELYHKNVQHLEVPLSRQRLGVGRMRSFLFFFGMLGVIALTFGAGFLTAYTFFPPKTQTFALSSQPSGIDKPGKVLPTGNSYAARSSLLKAANQAPLLEQAERQAQYHATQAARSSISQVLQKWSNSIRQTLGNFLGSAVVPLTTGLAQSAVNVVLPAIPSSPPLSSRPPSPLGIFQQAPAPAAVVKEDKPSSDTSSDPLTSSDNSPESGGRFSLQVQEFPTSSEAWELAHTLGENNLGAYVVRIERQNSLKFAVRIGQFKTYKESREAASLFHNQFHLPARIVTIHPFEERLK